MIEAARVLQASQSDAILCYVLTCKGLLIIFAIYTFMIFILASQYLVPGEMVQLQALFLAHDMAANL